MRPLLQASVPRSISLLFDLHGSLPLVEGDRGQMQQVIMNLVINAAEAVGPDRTGAVQVRTGTHRLSERELHNTIVRDHVQEGDFVCLEVQDDGAGMNEETQARIFDPFFTTKFTGRGLGLSAVMGIVRGHKGTLRVVSAPGRGSRFTIYLPCAAAPRPVPEKAATEPVGKLQGLVLVVDDDATVRRTAKAVLEQHGLNVLEADTGLGGVELFRANADRITLVLLDVTMPVVSGREALQRIEEIRRDVPVIMTSGYSEADAMDRFRDRRVAAFLQKPYTASELLNKVRGTLQPPDGAEVGSR
jgi:CheY-like chemotaxis protein